MLIKKNHLINCFLIEVLFLVYSFPVIAQKEASVWLSGTGYQLKFQSDSVLLQNFDGKWDATSSICDTSGNIVLYTDNQTIWNGNHEILVNGEGLHAENFHPLGRPEFLPWPGKDGYYFLIYESVFFLPGEGYKIQDKEIQYAEINTNAQNGRGEVISKGNTFHRNYHASPTIAGYCGNSYFWLIIDRNDNITELLKDRIYAYKIDENGINLTPVINDKYPFGNSHGYKFSPNGDKVYCSLNNVEYENLKFIADFNFQTGKISNFRLLRLHVDAMSEFSPNSQLFYFFSGGKLIQVDLKKRNSLSYLDSYIILLTLKSNQNALYPGQDLQLGADGKLYFTYYDVSDEKMKLGRINKPNQQGSACDVELDFMTANIYWFPDFATSFFRDKEPVKLDEFEAMAGYDIELCPHSSVRIGANTNPDAIYHWYPEKNLDNPFIAQPVFTHSSTSGNPLTEAYTLEVTDGNCWLKYDTVSITQRPAASALTVDGSWSVCPYVEKVDYWTQENGSEIYWLAAGGEIVSGQGTDSIKVNWKETNFDASVGVYSVNEYGCNSDTTYFPVRINVELITETPHGSEYLCVANRRNNIYQIKNTNGSVYDWVAFGGEIISGQGSNRVVVNWLQEGMHSLLVKETSTTIDTICYGESAPLLVEVINDSLEINLENVSFNLDNSVEITYSPGKLDQERHSLSILSAEDISSPKNEVAVSEDYDGRLLYVPEPGILQPETIELKVVNECNEVFVSNALQTTILKVKDVIGQQVSLIWNINEFWKNDRVEFEIWHAENKPDIWELLADNLITGEGEFINEGMALTHFFRVKAINPYERKESWSNRIKVELEDEVNIPDVFTPNGDGFNDRWEIHNIRFHALQQVTVYNRFGQKVYECRNDFIPWDGKVNGEIIQGTYLYELIFADGQKKYGQLTLLQ